MINEIFCRIDADVISFGATCKVGELTQQFERLRKLLEDTEEEEEKPEPKKKGFMNLTKK
tara:strand:+ start:5120 stop:5299 length:180 start_codon:yes stop_codon:yes gene_type:complete